MRLRFTTVAIVLTGFMLPASGDDAFNYIAGTNCVAWDEVNDSRLLRRANKLSNSSSTACATVYCSGSQIRFSNGAGDRPDVTSILYGRQGNTTRPFVATFRFILPDTGQVRISRRVTGTSTPNEPVRLAMGNVDNTEHCCLYNVVEVRIPPRSSIQTVYVACADDTN